ncbi:hypothetical protein R3P38DRAFT_2891201 [Favolaschia claudopus]|uniref:F-box domain-containing protein n=1 Tax=Favolaschia claudopus TaxID=2862362 RepID=A0AAW0CX64_9AGAR
MSLFAPQFPQELVDIIVDELHDDIPTLKACALTAPTFVASARIHIFRKIELTPPTTKLDGRPSSSSTQCQKLLKLLTTRPHIASLIKELCLVLAGKSCDVDFDRRRYPRIGGAAQGSHWVVDATRTLSLILPLLDLKRICLVENVAIYGAHMATRRLRWNDMGRSLRSALEGILSSPRLEAVHLRGMCFDSPHQLLSLFSEATSLKELRLSRLMFSGTHDWPATRPWRPQLRVLLLGDTYAPLPAFWPSLLHPQIDLSCVSSLTIAFMQQLKCNVPHLRVRFGRFIESQYPILNQNLRYLDLSAPFFTTLPSVFESLSQEYPALERITFEYSDSRTKPKLTPAKKSIIDQALAHLPSLKVVEVRRPLSLTEIPSIPFLEWARMVRDALHPLQKRNLLHVVEHRIPDHGLGHSFE